MAAPRTETTDLLTAWSAGDDDAASAVMDRLYDDLRRLAASRVDRSFADLRMRPTEVAHEAFLQLSAQKRTTWSSRTQFFAIAARVIRRVLANAHRDRRRLKRGGGTVPLPLELVQVATPQPSIDVLALEEALDELARIDPRAAKIVELRYFAGLTVEEVAATVDASRATVIRSWRASKLWLRDYLGRAPADGASP